MSRTGNKAIIVPENVTVTINGTNVKVEGPKGTLEKTFAGDVEIKQEANEINVTRKNNERFNRMMHGTTRAVLANMIEGVSTGFKKELEIVGIGYRCSVANNNLNLIVGYSHPVDVVAPEGITFAAPTPTSIVVEGIDKEVVGETAAKIRAVRKPEPYKGKGIKYKGEFIKRKEGKKQA